MINLVSIASHKAKYSSGFYPTYLGNEVDDALEMAEQTQV